MMNPLPTNMTKNHLNRKSGPNKLVFDSTKKGDQHPIRGPQPMSNIEAVKCDIAYQWMERFEEMHQARLKTERKNVEERAMATEKIQALEIVRAKQKEKISRLEADVEKSNSVIREMKRLLKDQRKVFDACTKQRRINYRQHQIIKEQRKEIRSLRLLKLRSKRLIRKLKSERPIATASATVTTDAAVKSEKREKSKYSAEDLEQAVQAVLAGQSLGNASKMFNVPKETLRQAKIKAQL